jgi:protein-L-isoaspartate(D-aspartate) O-methyltransferase
VVERVVSNAKRPGPSLREEMVAGLVRTGAIRSDEVRRAFLAVPRELFVPEIAERDGLEAVYVPDTALVTAADARGVPISSSSAPAIMAPMLEALGLRPGLRVLEVGAGTGYNAALLKTLVGQAGRVISIDIEPAFARRARRALVASGHRCSVMVGDGELGWPPGAPFDRIVATASAAHVPRAWRDQLVDGGLVELPLRLSPGSPLQAVVTLRRDGDRLHSTSIIAGSFMPLRGPDGSSPSTGVDPSLRALSGVPPTTMAAISGRSLASVSPRSSRRALATLLGPSHGRRSVPRDAAAGLMLFLAWGGAPRLVFCNLGRRYGVGIVDPAGTSVSALTRLPGGSGRIETWGDDRARAALEAHVARWEHLGRPTMRDLRITVAYGEDDAPKAWRSIRTADAVVGLEWASATKS